LVRILPIKPAWDATRNTLKAIPAIPAIEINGSNMKRKNT
jgi:hypothetical protein